MTTPLPGLLIVPLVLPLLAAALLLFVDSSRRRLRGLINIGATLLILTALAHQSIRGHRQLAPRVAPDAEAP